MNVREKVVWLNQQGNFLQYGITSIGVFRIYWVTGGGTDYFEYDGQDEHDAIDHLFNIVKRKLYNKFVNNRHRKL